ncbi:MAG: sugar phosphate isomerase/epimerase [Clostridiales bacterium]|nr:sugar phosphate isomerase/epimerase [Clostridiales bacterium]
MNKTLPIALQVYSVRDNAEKDFLGTLSAVKEMGYDGVEFAGLYGLSVNEIKAALAVTGLTAISAHVPYAELIEDMEGTVKKYVEIGCKFIAIPYMVEELRPGTPAYPETLENFRKIGEVCKANGVKLLYHNHDFEFVKLEDGRYALDAMYEDIPADLLETELDTCWVKVAGEDPVEYIKKYAGRAPIVHLKDFYKSGETSGALYDLIGIAPEEKKASAFEFRPVGSGMQDMPAILKASVEAGAQWVVVEQDRPSLGTAMEDVETSIEYLKKQGW